VSARLRIGEVRRALGTRELGSAFEAREARGVSTDTRNLQQGQLFFALSGPNFDGNQYARAAAQRGAAALVLRKDEQARALAAELTQLPVLLHPDPRRALGELAAWHRARLAIPVVGITGTAGKTTTKNMIVQLAGALRATIGSEKSFNNDIGVPLTLLRADETTELLVVEIGTNAPGEIEALCALARPTIGVVTGIGHGHLERLESLEGVAREKGALPAALPADGLCVLNADCRQHDYLAGRSRARVRTFSVEGDGDWNAQQLAFHAGGTSFDLRGMPVTLPLLGTHNVHDLLAALAVCCDGLGLPLERLLPGIAHLEGGRQRLERRELGGIALLDDTYNSNPESARAAVRVLAGMHGHTRRVLVLGDMLELGPLAPELHHQIGVEAARAGIDLVVLVGALSRACAAGALEGGLAPERVLHCADTAEAAARVPALLAPGDLVLLKASRGMAFESIVNAIGERRAPGRAGGGKELCLR
jgi:UDP-N-acetylmuramoyl-tripeptide--D-alanyl-D-alanine ligase